MFEILLWENRGRDGDCVSGVCMESSGAPVSSLELPTAKGFWSQQLTFGVV